MKNHKQSGCRKNTSLEDMSDETVILTSEDFADMQTKVLPKSRDTLYKPVVEYSMEGVFLNSFENASAAARYHKISNVSCVCTGKRLYCRKTGTIFLHRGDDINERLKLIDPMMLKLKQAASAREVWEYTLGGRLLFKWPAYKLAAQAAGVTSTAITKCCKGKKLFVGNRIYMYPDGDIKQRVKEVKRELYRRSKKRPKYREVDEYSLDGKFIKAYPTASDASRECGVHVSGITRCCNGTDGKGRDYLKTCGRIFLWVGDSISDRINLINDLKNQK